MKYIDIHAHVNFQAFDDDRDEVMLRAKENETGVINIGSNLENSKLAVEMSEKYDDCWSVVGQHPTHTDKSFDMGELDSLASKKGVVAIGECGLDYFHEPYDKDAQRELFLVHIKIAKKYNKPLMVHTRASEDSMDAYEDMLEIITKEKNKPTSSDVSPHFHLHFYSGDLDFAKKFLELGCTFSITGVITFTRDYDEFIKWVPIENLMVETDCPYLTPAPHRGERNEPIYVSEVVKKIAEIKNLDLEFVRGQMLENAERVFGVK